MTRSRPLTAAAASAAAAALLAAPALAGDLQLQPQAAAFARAADAGTPLYTSPMTKRAMCWPRCSRTACLPRR